VLQGSLWFLPSLMVAAAVAAAVALVEMQTALDIDLSAQWPRLFGSGAEGARAMLAAIATSMITVAGVVFSITVVALSLAASQYSPRVLRNFMSDRPTQTVLGAFVAIFAYCVVVLRTIRSPGEGDFVPSLAVLGGVVLAFVGIALLIYFVHHVASSLQVSSILTRILKETAAAIDRLFPDELGVPASALAAGAPSRPLQAWTELEAPQTGYLVGVDGNALLDLAREHDLTVRVARRVGDFIVERSALLAVSVELAPADDRLRQRLLDCFALASERTVHQDAPFGMQQIVDVALKALSPGVHDPTTASSCIDHLGALLVRLAVRRMPAPCRSDEGVVRVIAEGPDYPSMLAVCFEAIIHHAGSHAVVYDRLLLAMERLAAVTPSGERRIALADQVDSLLDRLARADLPGRAQRARGSGPQPSTAARGHHRARLGARAVVRWLLALTRVAAAAPTAQCPRRRRSRGWSGRRARPLPGAGSGPGASLRRCSARAAGPRT
jgi:uncharacterized membrane protein